MIASISVSPTCRRRFSLADIRQMIDLYDLGDGRRAQRAITIERCRERIATLQAQRTDIDAAILELEEFIDVIETSKPNSHPTKDD
jgi:DNA-binding transcriptional MerR regulator